MKFNLTRLIFIVGAVSFLSSAHAGFFDDLKEKLDEQVVKAKEQVEASVDNITTGSEPSADKDTSHSPAQQNRKAGRGQSDRAQPNLDIVGLRLGMPVEQARQVLKDFDAGMQLREMSAQLPRLANSNYLRGISAVSTSGDQIAIELATPPFASVTTRISRTKKYSQGAEPLLSNTLNAIKQKYGEPSIEKHQNQVLHQYYWLYDQAGNRYTAPMSAEVEQNCASIIPTHMVVHLQRQNSKLMACGVVLTIMVSTGATLDASGKGVVSDGLVGELVASLTNIAELIRNGQETQNHIDRTLRVQASSQGDPRL